MTDMAKEIASLLDSETGELRAEWRDIHRAEPPAGISRDLLIRAIAYHIQEDEQGGLDRRTKGKLRTLARTLGNEVGGSADPALSLKPGARLVREWNGRTYCVIALEEGFDFKGRRYRSLSQIAREITGTRWSGPRFFGLMKGAKGNHKGVEGRHEQEG